MYFSGSLQVSALAALRRRRSMCVLLVRTERPHPAAGFAAEQAMRLASAAAGPAPRDAGRAESRLRCHRRGTPRRDPDRSESGGCTGFARTRRVRARGRGVPSRRKRVGVVACVAEDVSLARATRSSGSRARRKTRPSASATLRGCDANVQRDGAQTPKQDLFVSSIAIATQDFDVASRHAREVPLSQAGVGERVMWFEREKAVKCEAEELCLRPRTRFWRRHRRRARGV